MPLYEYECQQCGRRFEVIQKFSDAPAELCVSCGGRVNRLICSPAFQFKGTGWYVTDYARKSSPAAESSSGDGKGEKSGKTEAAAGDSKPSKTESKPASESKS